MSWILDWHPVARRDLQNIPWRTAARVDAALMRYAETGIGEVTQMFPPDPRRMVLAVTGARALLFLDAKTRTILVGRVLPRA